MPEIHRVMTQQSCDVHRTSAQSATDRIWTRRVPSVIRCICLVLCISVLVSGTAPAQQKSAGAAKQDGKKTPDAKTPAQQGKTATAQPQSKDGVRDITLSTNDGWQLQGTYYESATGGKESPCVILLTSTDGADKKDARNRRIWQPAAVVLQKAGYAVVTVDLRKHGDSVPVSATGETPTLKMANNDYIQMAAADLEAVKLFLMSEHQAEKLNVRKLSIVSMGSSCMVAAAFAIADWNKKPYPDAPTVDLQTPRGQDVQALIMYSPSASVRGLNANTVLKTLKGYPISIHVIAATDNKDDVKSAEKVFKGIELKGDQFKDSRKMTLTPGETHAEAYLEGKVAEASIKDIQDFLTTNVRSIDAPWRDRTDRRSR